MINQTLCLSPSCKLSAKNFFSILFFQAPPLLLSVALFIKKKADSSFSSPFFIEKSNGAGEGELFRSLNRGVEWMLGFHRARVESGYGGPFHGLLDGDEEKG